jgi:probable HAF family extracellular repeat protein
MHPLLTLPALAFSCALLAAAPANAQAYTVTDLGILPGYEFSMGNGINESGQVTGYNGDFIDGTVSAGQAFLYRDGKMSAIGTVPGEAILGNGIAGNEDKEPGHQNDDKRKIRVTGILENSGEAHAFLYQDQFLRDLGLLPGGHTSQGYAVNSSGEVVGEADDANYLSQPFLYQHGNMIPLPTGGTLGGYASAINENGDVAGTVNVPGNYFVATLFCHNKAIPLGVLPGGNYSSASAINDALEIAGTSSTSNPSNNHAFLWDKGKLIDLGVLPTGSTSASYGINASGEVVGTANVFSLTKGSVNHAFLYSHGKMHDLNGMIPSNSGWDLEVASSINSRGEIVGTGVINGNTRAFLLTLDCNDPSNKDCDHCKYGR